MYFDGVGVKGGITTDASGSCVVRFGISAGTYLAGQRTVRISDAPVVANSTIAAEAVYYCTGLVEQRKFGSYSTRPPELRRQTVASETISQDPFNRDIDSLESTHWSDPLSQTFFVDKKTNPNGIFLRRLNLYFAAKDSALPVTVQIRPTVSGYPSPSVVIPFSTVVKKPSDVNANPAAPTATAFTFSSPVYLEPGEYSICVLANSSKYELFAADSAINGVQNSDSTIGRAGNNQLVGTLFTPQGIGPAVPVNSTDLMFTVDRCVFDSGINRFTYTTDTSVVNAQILKFYAPEILPTNGSITRSIGGVKFLNNDSLYLNTLFAGTQPLVYSLSRGADSAVSPVVDLSSLYATAVVMYANPSAAKSQYVSRVVDLPEGVVSNGVAAFVDSNIPAGSYITAYYRASINGESDIFTKAWIPMTQTNTAFTSTSEIDFREAAFRATTTQSFKAYQIRVDLGSSSANSTYFKTPAVRNIRTISFIQ